MSSLRHITTREDGQDLMEYGLLASLIAIVVLAMLKVLGTQIGSVYWGSFAAKF
jgi:Flp pilus assembly pilin Flp